MRLLKPQKGDILYMCYFPLWKGLTELIKKTHKTFLIPQKNHGVGICHLIIPDSTLITLWSSLVNVLAS
jgi:hypothetical protein